MGNSSRFNLGSRRLNPIRVSPIWGTFLGLAVFWVTGCTKPSSTNDQKNIEALIQKGQSGALLRNVESQISLSQSKLQKQPALLHKQPHKQSALLQKQPAFRNQKDGGVKKFTTKFSTDDTASPSTPEELEAIKKKILVSNLTSLKEGFTGEICSEIPDSSVVLNQERSQELIVSLGSCLRNEFSKILLLNRAVHYDIIFETSKFKTPLSHFGFKDLFEFMTVYAFDFWDTLLVDSNKGRPIRNQFQDSDLDELELLLGAKEQLYFQFSQAVGRFFQKRPGLAQIAARVSNRYEAMVGLQHIVEGAEPFSYNRFLVNLLIEKFGYGLDVLRVPDALVRTYAIEALIPQEGMELAELSLENEDPILTAFSKIGYMGGTFESRPEFRGGYLEFRSKDNPILPEHPLPSFDAARVVVLDSGIDFQNIPELGLFLSAGRKGEVGSADYADEDSIPYLPALSSDFGHGSGTSASVLTMFAKVAPNLLLERKLDLGVWKLDTIREVLSGPFMGNGLFISRPLVVAEAIIREVYEATNPGRNVNRTTPHIVSVSLGFRFKDALIRTGHVGLLRKAPWLWVMAAGNESSTVEERNFSCFQDIPSEERLDSKTLCVGALKRPVADENGAEVQAPKIANYSNYGNRVDVYAYETYTELCPNGTSCSTPAIAGAAGILKASFPSLKPEQIKQIIVQAAEWKVLEVEAGGDRTEKSDKVRVFDPETGMPRAIEIASRLVTH